MAQQMSPRRILVEGSSSLVRRQSRKMGNEIGRWSNPVGTKSVSPKHQSSKKPSQDDAHSRQKKARAENRKTKKPSSIPIHQANRCLILIDHHLVPHHLLTHYPQFFLQNQQCPQSDQTRQPKVLLRILQWHHQPLIVSRPTLSPLLIFITSTPILWSNPFNHHPTPRPRILRLPSLLSRLLQ